MYQIIGGDGREYGPVSADQVRDWIKQGRANAQTKIRPVAGGEWRMIAELPEFAGAAAPPPIPSMTTPGTAKLDIDALAAEVLARQPRVRVGDCLGRGWRLVTERFWLSVGVVLVGLLVQQVPLLFGVMQAGLIWFFLKRARGEEAKFDDAFAPFSVAFLQTFLAGLVMVLLLTGVFVVTALPALGLGFLASLAFPPFLIGTGLLCVVPVLVFGALWSFTWPLLMDKRLDFWPAMELSRKVLWPNIWGMLGLVIVSLGVLMLGMSCCGVGYFVALPVVLAAQACAYDDFFGRRELPPATPQTPAMNPPAPGTP